MEETARPAWTGHSTRDAMVCDVTIDLGGVGFTAQAEIWRKEEVETSDIDGLKKARLRQAYVSVREACEDWFNG